MSQIIKERYPKNEWNIYGCQASDGDNWPGDNELTYDILTKEILPMAQYFSYIEINQSKPGDLWPIYERVSKGYPNFAMSKILSAKDIFPVFRGLFEKKRHV